MVSILDIYTDPFGHKTDKHRTASRERAVPVVRLSGRGVSPRSGDLVNNGHKSDSYNYHLMRGY